MSPAAWRGAVGAQRTCTRRSTPRCRRPSPLRKESVPLCVERGMAWILGAEGGERAPQTSLVWQSLERLARPFCLLQVYGCFSC
jgi:hypothetical protein